MTGRMTKQKEEEKREKKMPKKYGKDKKARMITNVGEKMYVYNKTSRWYV